MFANNGAEQFRALRRHSANQQTAIAATPNGKLARVRILVLDQPLCGGDKVIKDVLLLGKHARLVPGLPELRSATDVGQRIHTALLHPPGGDGIENGGQAATSISNSIAGRRYCENRKPQRFSRRSAGTS